MECERYLQPLEVISFFLANGGQATNLELVNHFRHLLAKTEIGQENHAYLKRQAIRPTKKSFHWTSNWSW